jgi:O-antigen/teichoic acid export membrane protein
MGAEPFFFQQAKGEDAPKTYARVMDYFVMTICLMFLVVMLFLDVWKHFIAAKMWGGLVVVPILLVANMCLGVYYNLSIWYKLSHKTTAGATITFIGAALTLLINFAFIPRYGYLACAWATLACYAGMMVISFVWGQRVYPVPYNTKKLLNNFGFMLLLFAFHQQVVRHTEGFFLHTVSGISFLTMFFFYLFKNEKENLKQVPFIRKFIG